MPLQCQPGAQQMRDADGARVEFDNPTGAWTATTRGGAAAGAGQGIGANGRSGRHF